MSESSTPTKEAMHTPGPWKIGSITLTNRGFPTKHPHFEIVGEHSAEWIAHVLCFSDKNVGSEYEANAKLIAKAPALLERHKQLTSALHRSKTAFFYIRNLSHHLWRDNDNLEAICRQIEKFAIAEQELLEIELAKAKEITE